MIKYLRLKYIFIFYAIIRFPLHMLVINIDGKGRVYTLLLWTVLVVYLLFKKPLRTKLKTPFVIWMIWVSYAIANTMIQGMSFNMTTWQFFTYLIAPGTLMYLISNYYTLAEKNITFQVVTLASLLQVLIVFLFEKPQYYIGEGFRLGTTMNANEIGINAFLTLLFLYMAYNHNKMKMSLFLLLAIMPAIVVFYSGSRAAIIPFSFLFLSHFIMTRSRNAMKTIAIIVSGILIVFAFFQSGGGDILVFERLRFSKLEGMAGANTGTILDNLGSRATYFVYGAEIFLKNPVFGIGLYNYHFFNPISLQPNHVEIMIQLSELGIFGFFLFVSFNYWIGYKLLICWKRFPLKRKYTEGYAVGFISIITLSFTTYTYPNLLIFAFHGMTISHIMDTLSNGISLGNEQMIETNQNNIV